MTTVDSRGRSPLHYAALDNDVRHVRALLAAGIDPNLTDRDGLTPLHLAAQQGAYEVAELLLAHGASVDAANRHGNTPLFVAVFNSRGRGDLIGLLRRYGADPMRANQAGQTAVGLARSIANYDVARFFADVIAG